MREIGAFEAKNAFGALLDRVEHGEEIVITRHGKAVARLVPAAGSIDRVLAHAASERIRARARSLKTAFDWEALKADRDTGRPGALTRRRIDGHGMRPSIWPDGTG